MDRPYPFLLRVHGKVYNATFEKVDQKYLMQPPVSLFSFEKFMIYIYIYIYIYGVIILDYGEEKTKICFI